MSRERLVGGIGLAMVFGLIWSIVCSASLVVPLTVSEIVRTGNYMPVGITSLPEWVPPSLVCVLWGGVAGAVTGLLQRVTITKTFKNSQRWTVWAALGWAAGALAGYVLAYIVGSGENDLTVVGCGPILAISVIVSTIQWRFLLREGRSAAGRWWATGIVVGLLASAFWAGASEWVNAASPPSSEIDSEVVVLFLTIVAVAITGGFWGALEGVRISHVVVEQVKP